MEIARLEVSTQQHLERMQETAKVNYVQYGKSTKGKKGKKPQSVAGASGHRGSKPSGKGKKSPFPPDTCYRCGKSRHQKAQDCKAVDTTCRGCGKKKHFEKVLPQGEMLHTLSRSSTGFHQLCRGQGPVNPSTLMMEDNQCTLIWSVSPM